MQLFYLPQISDGLVSLSSEEARHAVQVLRKKVGDELDIVDGRGTWYRGTIVEATKKSCQLSVVTIRKEMQRNDHRLIMAVSPTKSNERFEWFLEKATEIGVDEIIPLKCKRTERPRIRHDRYEKVLVSAMKQSLQAWLPKLHPLMSFADALELTADSGGKYIGWCDESIELPLLHNYQPTDSVCIFIGPEGDFTEEEVNKARTANFLPITLGPNRLRTETAALSATQMIAFLEQKKP